ncbi:MAG: thioredoxin family protein [Candidatus Falkowbacteria bacterium]
MKIRFCKKLHGGSAAQSGEISSNESYPDIITTEQFNGKVLGENKFVLVLFFAKWCAPCKRMMPIIRECLEKIEIEITLYCVNVDESPELPPKHGVAGVPVLILFNEGLEVYRVYGADATEVEHLLKRLK